MLESFRLYVKNSVNALLANKFRSFLTMLGIIIGVASVIIIVAIGAGAQGLILEQVKSLGTNVIGVLPGHSEDDSPFSAMLGFSVTTLTYEDALALKEKKNVPNIVELVAYSRGVGKAVWRDHSYDTQLSGVTTGYLFVEGGVVEKGRFFNEEEERNFARVAVLGKMVKEELFGDSDAVGQKIRIKDQNFEVIGVMRERGVVAMQDHDDQILLPMRTTQKLLGVNHIGIIRAKIDSDDNLQRAKDDVRTTLRERHDITDFSGASDDFTVRSSAEALDVFTVITDALRYFLAAMAALSLLVGGIGIMNIMLISVTERTREIGLRKAIGANNANILGQFLSEAVMVTFIGGVIGVILGISVSFLIVRVVQLLGYSWPFVVPLYSVLLGLFVSVIIGLVFGIYPAQRASKLDPIEALRYE